MAMIPNAVPYVYMNVCMLAGEEIKLTENIQRSLVEMTLLFTVVLDEELCIHLSVLFTLTLGSLTLTKFSKRNNTERTPMLERTVKAYLKERER